MKNKQKIRFIFIFAATYALLLLLGIFVFGNILIAIEEKTIHLILGNFVNYQAFDFVVYCSGIVSIAAYLGVIVGFLAIKQKLNKRLVWISVILLYLINLLRIIIVMLSEKIGLHKELHVFSWFLMALVIVWLIKISTKK